jgi:hypothetical protein
MKKHNEQIFYKPYTIIGAIAKPDKFSVAGLPKTAEAEKLCADLYENMQSEKDNFVDHIYFADPAVVEAILKGKLRAGP